MKPKLRFEEFSAEWELLTFEEKYGFIPTNSLSRDNLNYERGQVKNIHYGDIHTKFSTLFYENKEMVPYVNEDVNLNRITQKNYLKKGDLVIADASEGYADIGKAIEVMGTNNERILAGLHTHHARPKQQQAFGFMAYSLQSWFLRKQIMKVSQGAKVLGLSSKQLAKVKCPTPSFPEQQKIASFLSGVDKCVELLQKKKVLLEDYKKGVMQKLFSQQIRFKDENGNDFPDWEDKKLGEVANYRRGSFPQPYGLKKWYDENGEPFVQVYDVADNMKLKPSTKNKISSAAQKQSVFVKRGTLLITIQGSIGRIAKVQYDCYVDRTLLIFRNFKIPIEVDFFKYVLYLLFEIEKLKAPGGTIKTITKEKLTSFKLLLPVLEEQQKIASFLSAIDSKIETTNQQIKGMQSFKKGLLQEMFV